MDWNSPKNAKIKAKMKYREKPKRFITNSIIKSTPLPFQVWELHSLTLVMLNREDETEPYEAYFPLDAGVAEFGNIRVEFVRRDDHRDYSVTILRIFNKEVGLSFFHKSHT